MHDCEDIEPFDDTGLDDRVEVLDELVTRAKAGEFKPRRDSYSWRREPRRAGELTTEWRGG